MKNKSEYVRHSAAKNFNDISKDNPEAVLQWAEQWLGDNEETDWLIKHACRSLLKQGNAKALSLFGFTDTEHIKLCAFKVQPEVMLGNKLHSSFILKSQRTQLGKCRIEFAIDFMKENSNQNREVFKISEGEYDKKEKPLTKYFSFKEISTRKYYTDSHVLTILINGVEKSSKQFHVH